MITSLLTVGSRSRYLLYQSYDQAMSLKCCAVTYSCRTELTISTCVASASSVLLRQKILRKCREDIYHFFDRENGQVAIYDAVNPMASGRRTLAKEFAKHDIQV